MKKRDFTLVELLAVTALIVILAGLGFAAFSYASNRGKEAATKSLVTRIAAGLESMRTKHGSFPVSATPSSAFADIVVTMNGTTGLITKINFGSGEISDAKRLKTFLTVCDGESLKKSLTLKSDSDYYLTDSWGGKIKYCCPGKINTAKFDLVAPGTDGGFGKNSTPAATPPDTLSGYKEGDEWVCDDIANFN